MKDPHNHAKVGYSMIAVAASLAVIGIMALFIPRQGLGMEVEGGKEVLN